jgi:hypothetical protein
MVAAIPVDTESGLSRSDLAANARDKWVKRVTSDILNLEGNGAREYLKGRGCPLFFSSIPLLCFFYLA